MKRYVFTIAALVALAACADAIAHPVLAQKAGQHGAKSLLSESTQSGTSSDVSGTPSEVLDFEDLATPPAGYDYTPVVSYSKDGFTLTNPSYSSFDAFAAVAANNDWYQGSTSLVNTQVDDVTLLKRDDGQTFTVASIDLTGLNPTQSPCPVTFTGTRVDGSTVTQTFTTDGLAGFQTFPFQGFTDLVSLSWVQSTPYHQFDNIALDPVADTPKTKSDCWNGGWQQFGFRNQGQCIRLVETGQGGQ